MATFRYSWIRLLSLPTALAACGGAPAVNGESHTIVDSAGIRIVESLSPAWGDRGRRIEAEPFLRIGREEEGPYQFGVVRRGVLLDGGRLAVIESSAAEVRIFDAAGTHVRTLGRRGDGPGEFRLASGMFRYAGDSLVVYDQILRRTTIFSESSGSYRTVRNQMAESLMAFGVLGDGRMLLFDPGGGYRPEAPPGLQWDTTDIVAMDLSDGSFRIIGRLASREQFVEPGGDTRRLAPAHGSIRAVAEDGFYWATSDRYEIRFYDREGTVRRIMRRPVQPRAVEPAMIEAWVEANLEWVRRREGDAALPRYRRRYEEAHYGSHVPLFGIAFVDRDQRLWVSEAVWPSLRTPPRRWSVFSRDGIWLGDLEAPERLRIVDSRGDVVLGVWQDALDVPYVQLHRLVAR